MNKKITMMIGLMLVVILCFVFFLSRVIVNNNITTSKEGKSKENNSNSYLENEVYTSKELEEGITYSHTKGKIMTEAIVNSVEQQARYKISQFDFVGAQDYMAEVVADYDINNSPAFDKIKKMYHDLALMSKFEYLVESKQENILKNMIQNLQDVENFFISVMWLDRADRESFIYMNDSINPVFYGGVKVLKKEIVDEENIHEEIRRRFEDIDEVIKFEFDIEDNILLAYIVKSNDKFHLFKIVEKEEGTTHYLTIKEWRDFYNKFNGNDSGSEKSIDNENIEDKIADDNSTTYIDLTEGDDS